jgi:hypothetical protein
MYRALLCCLLIPAVASTNSVSFAPTHRLTGIGLSRTEITDMLLAERTQRMIDSQTFSILRDPRSVEGAERITGPKLAKIFAQAGRESGLPASLISAVAYLESFGEPTAQSPTGPKGIMQISSGTAKAMGLRMIYSTKTRTSTEKQAIKKKNGKIVYKKVRTKSSYSVLLRDERMVPERAIPAAARYLARLQGSLGGLDWAVFAYHCGEGCVGMMRALTESASGISRPITVAKMFFGATPTWNRDLYLEIKRQMDRDYSPTYWFRVMRAQQLLGMYKEDKSEFMELADYYRYEPEPTVRASHRLAVWLKSKDMLFQHADDIRNDGGKLLAKAFDDPEFFGFSLRKEGRDAIGGFDLVNQSYYMAATPAAIGTLTYIAYETRRLHAAMNPRDETFVPLEVTSLVRPCDSTQGFVGSNPPANESFAHCSGQVFDVEYGSLPPGEREALQFVLDDIGWEGYLGFIDESPNSGTMHIGCSPSSRAFFAQVYEDALAAAAEFTRSKTVTTPLPAVGTSGQ